MSQEGITSVDELRRVQEAAQAQGTSITNYNQWAEILADLETAGIKSSGSFEGDKKLHDEIKEEMLAIINEVQEEQARSKARQENNDLDKTDYKTSQDKDQGIKASIVNATSSMIMADYMKYYHLLH